MDKKYQTTGSRSVLLEGTSNGQLYNLYAFDTQDKSYVFNEVDLLKISFPISSNSYTQLSRVANDWVCGDTNLYNYPFVASIILANPRYKTRLIKLVNSEADHLDYLVIGFLVCILPTSYTDIMTAKDYTNLLEYLLPT